MKVLVVLSALVAFAAAAALTPTELDLLEAYDYDTLLASKEQIEMYILGCLLGQGECGPYREVAELTTQLIINQCAECSPTLKVKYDCVLKQFRDKYEYLYNELMEKVIAKKG